jgi:hypothetical protein
VATTDDPLYQAALARASPKQTVLEFSKLKQPSDPAVRPKGFLW